MSHKTKTIVGTTVLIAAAISAPAYAQDTVIPVINGAPAAPQIQAYEPLRPQTNPALPLAPEMEVTPLPEGTVPTTLPAPIQSAPIQARPLQITPAPQTATCLLYTSPSPRDQRGSRMPSSA